LKHQSQIVPSINRMEFGSLNPEINKDVQI